MSDKYSMSRLFTFGCSFTNFFWPTWADILGREFDEFENWGQWGAGNSFIAYSVVECAKRNKIQPTDTVIVMWSSVAREDFWKHGSWQTTKYDELKFDPTGYLLRDLANIALVKALLETLGCTWYFLSIVPFDYQDSLPDPDEIKFYNKEDIDYSLFDLYADDLAAVRTSVYTAVFNNDWYSRSGYSRLEEYKNSYLNQAGPDWPSWQKFLQLNFSGVKDFIVDEIKQRLNLDKRLIRTDRHPTPAEHLEYLDLILPEVRVSEETRKWVSAYNNLVLAKDSEITNDYRSTWVSKTPKVRF